MKLSMVHQVDSGGQLHKKPTLDKRKIGLYRLDSDRSTFVVRLRTANSANTDLQRGNGCQSLGAKRIQNYICKCSDGEFVAHKSD